MRRVAGSRQRPRGFVRRAHRREDCGELLLERGMRAVRALEWLGELGEEALQAQAEYRVVRCFGDGKLIRIARPCRHLEDVLPGAPLTA